MSFTKKDRTIRSASGKVFPKSSDNGTIGGGRYALIVAEALQREFGGTNATVKKLAALTGTNERAVKNWLAAKNGPNGESLVGLIKYSDEVLVSILLLAGRSELVTAKKFVDARHKLREMLALIDQLQKGN